jgi:hypothetical protein
MVCPCARVRMARLGEVIGRYIALLMIIREREGEVVNSGRNSDCILILLYVIHIYDKHWSYVC